MYSLPNSPNTIRDHFATEFAKSFMIVTDKFDITKKNGGRLLVSFDESVSVRNQRYISLNLQYRQIFEALGMIRVKGNTTNE